MPKFKVMLKCRPVVLPAFVSHVEIDADNEEKAEELALEKARAGTLEWEEDEFNGNPDDFNELNLRDAWAVYTDELPEEG